MASFPIRTKSLSVFSASAGAGKTFRLAAEYLATALRDPQQPKAFVHILALTFTNKAANEMKRRILDSLRDFSEVADFGDSKGLASAVCEILEISDRELAIRARKTLELMLHDYGSIGIGTLDQFTHKLVRTFALELGLPGQFEVELEQELLLDLAVQELMTEVGSNQALTNVLIAFAESNVEDEKGGDIYPALLDMAAHLSKETSVDALRALGQWSLDSHADAQKALQAFQRHLLESAAAIGTAIFDALERANTGAISNLNYYTGIAGRLLKRDPAEWVPSASLQKVIEDPMAVYKTAERSKQGPELGQELGGYFQRALELAGQAMLVKEIRKNDRSASVMVELSKALERVLERLRIQPLWKFNRLIHDELGKQPAAYLFERLGERYQHFFVDEAQDTSTLQWANLWPLLENALSAESGSSLIVGDGKQSIYRWRGSDAESFLTLIERSEAAQPPLDAYPSLQGRTEHIPLQDNWRSRTQIVDFNNALFADLAAQGVFTRPTHATSYQRAPQNPKGKPGGRVDVRLLPSLNQVDLWPLALDTLVRDLRTAEAAKWAWADMAILVRDKRQGRAIALRLAKEDIPVVSSELLALSSSSYVLAMAAIMNWMLVPLERDRQWAVLKELHAAGLWAVPASELHLAGAALSQPEAPPFATQLKAILPGFDADIAWKLSLYEMGEYLARALKIAQLGDPFVLRFLDALHDFSHKQLNRLEAFMSEWARKKDAWSISAPPGMDAIELLTIHASKGLEYPLVYVPFATLKPKDGRSAWMALDWTELFGLDTEAPPSSLLSLKSMKEPKVREPLHAVHPEYVEAAERAVEERIFDDYNLLYVAFTRSRDGLTFYLTEDYYGKDLWAHIARTYPGTTDHLQLGEWPAPVDRAAHGPAPALPWPMAQVASDDWTHRVRLARFEEEGPEQRLGNAVHRVMERIRRPGDAAQALAQAAAEMQWTAEERQEVEARVAKALSDERLKPLFEAAEIYTERPLLMPEKGVKRPDRVVKLQDGRWLVVDYKTGDVQEEHATQIERYAEGLTSVLGTRPGTLRVYLRDQIDVYGS